MQSPSRIAARIADEVERLPKSTDRTLIAVAGPPASGKSTIASALSDVLTERGIRTGLVGMDGFHLDNPILDARGLRHRKGAPETFDVAGFAALMRRLVTEEEVIAPYFDRNRDLSVGSGVVIDAQMRTVVVEGNYLLLDEPGWRAAAEYWTFSVALSVGFEELERRLVERWLHYGFSAETAREKALSNDIPNARTVLLKSTEPNLSLSF